MIVYLSDVFPLCLLFLPNLKFFLSNEMERLISHTYPESQYEKGEGR